MPADIVFNLQRTIKSLNMQLMKLQDENHYFQKASDLEDEVSSLKKQSRELKKENSALKADCTDKDRKIKQLEKSLAREQRDFQIYKEEAANDIHELADELFKANKEKQELQSRLKDYERIFRMINVRVDKLVSAAADDKDGGSSPSSRGNLQTTSPNDSSIGKPAPAEKAKESVEALDTMLSNINRQKRELNKQLSDQQAIIEATEADKKEAQKTVLSLMEKIDALEQQKNETKAALDLEKAKNRRNSTNSSKPSSTDGFNHQVQNNREKSGNRPGAQPGHTAHFLQMMVPDEIIELPVPNEYYNNPLYELQKEIRRKQMVDIEVTVHVTEYQGQVFKNKKTGKNFCPAVFPHDLKSQISYGPFLGALLVLLRVHCNVPYRKITDLLTDMTNCAVNIAPATVMNKQNKMANTRTEEEEDEIKQRILAQKYLHVDATTIHVDGELWYVLMVGNQEGILYYYGDKKGFELTSKSLLGEYQGILVHDAERTFFHYGIWHQLCLAHELRYLKGIIQNEPESSWADDMHKLLQEAIHTANLARASENYDPDKQLLPDEVIEDFHERYGAILDAADAYYASLPEDVLAGKEGIKVARRLRRNWAYMLTFLVVGYLPSDDNFAERSLRTPKTHTKQNGGFRSGHCVDSYLDCLMIMREGIQNGNTRLSTFQERF